MQHPLSFVHPDAQIGNNVEIGPFVTIDKNVVIGDGTRIMSNATILEGARIGKNCTIFPGAVVSAIPQDLKFRGEETTAEIGDNTTIGAGAVVTKSIPAMATAAGVPCKVISYDNPARYIGNPWPLTPTK